MQSEPGLSAAEKAKPSFFHRFFHRFRRRANIRITPEIHARLNAPAQLFIWQSNGETEDNQIFDTLREAIVRAPDDTAARAFIVTENGHILRPAQIFTLKQFLKTIE